ncbi:MAG: DNA cytosine methyltransferase [Hyphomicrobiaceae bacterium]|nr:DNA cytosine methyltransferase [Hyphomicrobiaceae bacterium]
MRGLDLFSGPGGMTLGFKRAGIEPLVCVEKRKDAVETYSWHTPDADHFCSDIRTIDFHKYAGKIDIVYGGPPCQPFSTGGLQRGTSDPRNMFPEFIRVLSEVKPAVFVAENVPGLTTRKRIQYLVGLITEFEEMGFNVSWRVLYSADYGVPQKRRRLFIVGFRDGDFWFPNPTHGPTTNRLYKTSGEIISHEPFGEPPDCPVVFAKYPDTRRSPYAGQVYNGGGRPIDMAAPCHTILAAAGGYKTHWIDTQNIAVEYNRHLLSGGEPWSGEVPGARRMTIEESALIQSFPAGMKFAGSRSSQYTQVGDAVPPDLAEVVARAVVEQLEGGSVSPLTHLPSENQTPLFAAVS